MKRFRIILTASLTWGALHRTLKHALWFDAGLAKRGPQVLGHAHMGVLPACIHAEFYLILLCIIIRRHIHARPHMYHAGLRDHMQQMQSVTCRYSLCKMQNLQGLVMQQYGGYAHPFYICCLLPSGKLSLTPMWIKSKDGSGRVLPDGPVGCFAYISVINRQ